MYLIMFVLWIVVTLLLIHVLKRKNIFLNIYDYIRLSIAVIEILTLLTIVYQLAMIIRIVLLSTSLTASF